MSEIFTKVVIGDSVAVVAAAVVATPAAYGIRHANVWFSNLADS